MKGIIFTLVEDAVVAEHGEGAWDALLDRAGLDGAYTALGDYPDADLDALVAAGAQMLDASPGDLTRTLGHASLLGLAGRYPHFFAPHRDARSFLLTLNDVIHPEVRKLHEDAEPPEFRFEETAPDRLRVHYVSVRRLCALAEGMIAGAGAHYGDTVTVEQAACVADGHDHCVLDVTFARG